MNLLRTYRPLSNLAYTGKLLEKVAAKRLVNYVCRHGLGEELQSAYKAGYRTETALLKVHDDATEHLTVATVC